MSERWLNYVERGIQRAGGPVPFALAQWTFLFPVFLAVRRLAPEGGRILDVGCGSGIFTGILAHHGYGVVGVDDDPAIVAYAREMVRDFRSPATVEQASAFDLRPFYGRFDLVFSLGLVEHFEPDVTVALVAEQLRCAPVVITVVPTRHLVATGTATDERFYSRREMNALVRKAGCRVVESFVFGQVQSKLAINAERFLPRVVYREVQTAFTWGMDICVVGRRD